MKRPNPPQPPNWLRRFFRWYCKPEYLEDIEGDLQERFFRNFGAAGKRTAQRQFFWDVLLLFRPGIIRSPSFSHTFIPYTMLRFNLILAFRNALRHKGTFFINLAGFSVGLACALMIYLWVQDERKIDNFHPNGDQLYQVMHNLSLGDGIRTISHTPGLLAQALTEEIPEVEIASSVVPPSWFNARGIISVEKNHLKALAQYADTNYFRVFSWELLYGDREKALNDKHAVLLSDHLAKKLFKTPEEAMGKTIEWDMEEYGGSFTVAGVFVQPPSYSTSQFDLVFNYGVYLDQRPFITDWRNSDPSTFAILKPGTDIDYLTSKINALYKAKYQSFSEQEITDFGHELILRRYADRYLYNRYENGVQAGGRITYVRLFSLIALAILVIACINFMNLATAKATQRMKEIGIKKTLGVHRKTLVFQFMGESMLMAFLSMGVALFWVATFLPTFNQITGKFLSLNFNFTTISAIVGISFLAGLLAGSYPALYLSGFTPIQVLKSKLKVSVGELWTRRGLVVFQFVVSIMLILAVWVVHQQIAFVQAKNLGYDRNHIVSFKKEGQLNRNIEPFLTTIKEIPGVLGVASFGHDLVGNHGGTSGLSWENKDPNQRVQFANLEMSYGLLEILNIKMREGRIFSQDFATDSSAIIFNEAAIAAMGLENPIGKTIKLWRRDYHIIGVSENFHFKSLHDKIAPCFMRALPQQNLENVWVKVEGSRMKESLALLGERYEEYNQGLPFEYSFLDDDYRQLYISEQRVASLSRYFAGIAILISCLGLLGLATYTAERRIKEMGIRKILGATEWQLVQLLSRDFTRLILFALLLALPLSYLLAQNWLQEFAYRTTLNSWMFVGTGIVALFIAWTTVGFQTLKVARMNPAECLRDE